MDNVEDLHERWPHRWLSHKAEAKNSEIQGTGVFAKEKIFKDEVIGVLGGIIVQKKDILEYRSLMTHVGIQIDHDFFIVPSMREELEKFGVFNHSCEPNIGFSNSLIFIAIRDINPKEELTFDYAFSETFYEGFDCHCGTKNCRKKIKPTDYQNKNIHEKYGQYFSPYLKLIN